MDEKCAKSKGGSKGVDFQIDLLAVSLLNAIRQNIKDWKLSTENKLAGKFDDVVLELSDGSAILLQAKHKEKKKITLGQIISTNSKKEDFSLPKYFLSYLVIRTKIPVKLILICTNTQVESKVFRFLNKNSVSGENILHYQDGTSFFTFNDGIVEDLITNAKVYHETNSKGKGIDETLITEENAREFLEHLQLHLTYPSGNDLENIIEKLLGDLKHLGNLFRNISHRDLHQKIKNWFQQPKWEYFTENRAKAMFCEIKSEKCRDWLENYKVFFKCMNFKIADSNKRIFHIITKRGHLLHLLKVYRSLQQNTFKILYASSEHCIEVQKQMIKAFELPIYTHLIIISPKFTCDSILNEVCDILTNILHNRVYKKVIFVGDRENKFIQRMKSTKNGYEIFDECLSLQDVSEDVQEMLLNKKNIIFQGEKISLGELLREQITDDYKKYIKSEILEKLIIDEKITVGKGFTDLEKDLSQYYVDRNFEKIIDMTLQEQENLGYPHYNLFGMPKNESKKNMERKEIVSSQITSSEDICNIDDNKIIVISDSAGMGKTTVLKNLAIAIKRKNNRLWVIRIELNQCTHILNDCLLNNRSISILDLLNCNHTTQITNELETFLLSLAGTVVLMLDGVDEISPDFTNLILDLLLQCQNAENLKKIFVTTRPHMSEKLNKHLNVTFFKLAPFTEQNQMAFFIRYWTHTLQLKDDSTSKCERYARALVSKVSSWIDEWYKDDVKFVASPLHASMLAEIFLENQESEGWEGLKEYLRAGEDEPKLPEDKMHFAKFYEKFIAKKKDIFLKRGNPVGNPSASEALVKQFDECLAFHRLLAMKTMIPDRNLHGSTFLSFNKDISRENWERIALKMGILQTSNNQLVFIHRTFAEYFVADCILKELQLKNPDALFQSLLIDRILSFNEFQMVRRYLDNFLQNQVPSISTDNFKSYRSKIHIKNNKLMESLAEDGNTEIIRFVLKLIDFKIPSSSPHRFVGCTTFLKRRKNTLTRLKYLTKRYGLNLGQSLHETPLVQAIIGGHLGTVKFLVEMGADVNLIDKQDYTCTSALHSASACGHLDIVEYLVDIGVDVNIVDRRNRTALHDAILFNRQDIVAFLVEHGSDLNIRNKYGSTALHFATYFDTFETFHFLARNGADINVVNKSGQTLLHNAYAAGDLEIANFLLEHGLSMNAVDKEGNTPLDCSVRSVDYVFLY